MRSKLAAVAGAVAVLAVTAAPAVAKGPGTVLEFRGLAIVPTGTTFEGTSVGGLSSITSTWPGSASIVPTASRWRRPPDSTAR